MIDFESGQVKRSSFLEDRIVTTDRWTVLEVLLSRVSNLVELWVRSQYTTSKPHGILLHQVLGYFTIYICADSTDCLVSLKSFIDDSLHLLLESLVEAIKQSASS